MAVASKLGDTSKCAIAFRLSRHLVREREATRSLADDRQDWKQSMPERLSAAPQSPLVRTGRPAGCRGDRDLRILACPGLNQAHPDGSYSFVSGKPDWDEAHIPGSIHVDVLEDLSDPAAATSLTMPPVPTFARLMAE